MTATPEPEPLLRIEYDAIHKVATFYMPQDLTAATQDQINLFLDDLVSARAEWESKGYKIRYRPYPPRTETVLPPASN